MRVVSRPAADSPPVPQILGRLKIPFEVNGRGWAEIRCPFHEDDNPSCAISLETGWYTCLGCGASGNLLSFVEKVSKVGTLDAFRLVKEARRDGVPESIALAMEKRSEWVDAEVRDRHFADRWMGFHKVEDWAKIPLANPTARYLIEKRGLHPKILNAFDVRMDGFSLEYPVVFPIWMGKGNLVGYQHSRIDGVDDPKGGKPKYRFPGGGFEKSEVVAYYEIDRGPCVVVEGIIDLIKAAQFGCSRAACIFGSKISKVQSAWLRDEKKVNSVVCALDNDAAGEEGFHRMRGHFKHVVRFKFSRPGQDVGDLSKPEFHFGMP